MELLTKSTCTLCSSKINPIYLRRTEADIFCCKGCEVVYHILKAQGALESFQDHPVYQQALKSGLITNPHFEDSKKEEKIVEEELQKLPLIIQNMWCPSCALVIHLILSKEPGIQQCVVDYATDLALIEYQPRFISKEKIIRLISQLGYQPQFLQNSYQQTINRSLMLRLIVAIFFSLNIMMFSYPIYATYFDGHSEGYEHFFAWLSLVGSLPVLFYSGWPIWRRCYTALKVGIWGMEVLVCIGVGAATILSLYELFQGSAYVYFDSMTIIITFVLLGKVMESKAKFSANDAFVKLNLALPRRGRKRFPNGEEQFVPIKDIQVGDYLTIYMGEKIVLDGIVQEGIGACNEALMTGESMPVAKQERSLVLAGSILQQGYLIIKVTASLEETTLHRIIDMLGEDIEHKSRYVRATDQIVRWFIPFVISLALATIMICFIWQIYDESQTVLQTAMIRAISILLISCPCAIGIAVPLAESYCLNILAKLGIIVRNRGCLNYLGRETVFVFDKTGTITEGHFKVCQGLENLTFEDKKILKGLVSQSLHPIAMAIREALLSPLQPFEQIEEYIGKGLQGFFQGKKYYLGSAAFLKEQGIALTSQNCNASDSVLTTIYFAREDHCLATLLLGDRIKPGIKSFIRQLSSIKTVLISGDGEAPVKQVAQECQIQEWYAECLPLQKRKLIDTLKEKGEVVAMLGDGVNDAPALAAAHIGIAVVSASDISNQVSDLLLTVNNFQSLEKLHLVGIKGHRIIKQNLFWAFFYNFIGLGLATAGLLTPLFAACAMVLSSLIVLLNAQRLSSITSENNL